MTNKIHLKIFKAYAFHRQQQQFKMKIFAISFFLLSSFLFLNASFRPPPFHYHYHPSLHYHHSCYYCRLSSSWISTPLCQWYVIFALYKLYTRTSVRADMQIILHVRKKILIIHRLLLKTSTHKRNSSIYSLAY